ncbi:hypothetical protein B0H11DRAFT_1973015, partial [Mycena galericulata]
ARLLLEISSNIFLQACPSARRLLLIVIMIGIGNGAGRSSKKLSFVLCLQNSDLMSFYQITLDVHFLLHVQMPKSR